MLLLMCWMDFLPESIYGGCLENTQSLGNVYDLTACVFAVFHHQTICNFISKPKGKIENNTAALWRFALRLLRFICLKFVRRGCHIWPQIRWRGTFIAPATSSSLFLSLLWAIQDPKQPGKQCCAFSLQAFSLLKKSMGWTNKLLPPERLLLKARLQKMLSISCYWCLAQPFGKADIMWSKSFREDVVKVDFFFSLSKCLKTRDLKYAGGAYRNVTGGATIICWKLSGTKTGLFVSLKLNSNRILPPRQFTWRRFHSTRFFWEKS